MLEARKLANADDDYVLHHIVRQIRPVREEIADANKRIRMMALKNGDAKTIVSMTGLDAFGAALLVALEIDGIGRFPNPGKLVSWARLCPTVRQSGKKDYRGRMKKDSNRRVNRVMVQAAKIAARYDRRMGGVYERTRKAHPYHVAVSHVSTKILTIIWHMLHDRKLYDGTKDALYARKLKKLESQDPGWMKVGPRHRGDLHRWKQYHFACELNTPPRYPAYAARLARPERRVH